MATVLVIGDTHEPFCHPQYFRFISDMRDKYDPDTIVHIGDVVDQHSASVKYLSDPNGRSTGDEFKLARKRLAKWHDAFPDVRVCIGNHDARHIQAARKVGLNDEYLRDYAEVWNTPSWTWRDKFFLDGVLYEHGTGTVGKDAAIRRAINQRSSLVMGHTHTFAGVTYHANASDLIFGLNVGCGIDARAYAFEYGTCFTNKPVLGCGLVIDGEEASFIAMGCGAGQKYRRRR